MKVGLSLTLISIILLLLSVFSCTEEEVVVPPVIETKTATDIGLEMATITARIPEVGSRSVKEYGIVYATTHDGLDAHQSVEGSRYEGKIKVGATPPDSSFSTQLTFLNYNTTYYYKVYMLLEDADDTYVYGDLESFTTSMPEITEVVPNKALPGDTIVLRGKFISDTTIMYISFTDTTGVELDDQHDIIQWSQDSIVVAVPLYRMIEKMNILYNRDAGDVDHVWQAGKTLAQYEGFEIWRSTIVDFYPKVGVANETEVTMEVDYLNPLDERNKVYVNNREAEITEIKNNRITFLAPYVPASQTCQFNIQFYNGALTTESSSAFTYGVKYTVEDADGNSLDTLRAGELVVFKVFSNSGISGKSRQFMFGELTAEPHWWWAEQDGTQMGVYVPADIPLGRTEVRMQLNEDCATVTESNTSVVIME